MFGAMAISGLFCRKRCCATASQDIPTTFAAHLNLGTLLLRRKQPATAITHLREALRMSPEQAQALDNFGAALQSEGRIEEAVGQLRHALRVQPEYPNARHNLANALLA
jgi:Flp pilus assembly protein TadD